jgi:hypothetical protein
MEGFREVVGLESPAVELVSVGRLATLFESFAGPPERSREASPRRAGSVRARKQSPSGRPAPDAPASDAAGVPRPFHRGR